MKFKTALLVALGLTCTVAFASGAPWYKWQNSYDNTMLCSQNAPGETWHIVQGPFMESQCRKPGNPQ
jgi:hypothetical protein